MNLTFELARILEFVFSAAINILPFFFVSIIIAAGINQFSFTNKLSEFLKRNIKYSILIATIIGALSPLCACGVIPTLFALINVGIPIAPIMSFWITSPIMSPEAFLITWGNLGIELAVVRLIATIVMGLIAGFITIKIFPLNIPGKNWLKIKTENETGKCGCDTNRAPVKSTKISSLKTFLLNAKKLTIFLGGWLLLAFLLEALIVFYIPQEIVIDIFGEQNIFSVLWAAVIGIPLYFNNISAIPIVSGLMQSGMSKGSALAFLLAGPITAIPAMIAVFGIVKIKVFLTFLVIGFILSVLCGYIYEMFLYFL